MNFYSEYGEDRWLYDNGFIMPKGTYVDIGAAWPKDYSNTALLRDLGWTGIQVDGWTGYKPLWQELGLDLIVEVVWTDAQARYSVNSDKPNLSKITKDAPLVPARKLDDILRDRSVQKIDFLSVDVESSEYAVVSTMDFERHQPSIIIWEYNTLGVKSEELAPFLEARGYQCVHKTECNYVHVHPAFRSA